MILKFSLVISLLCNMDTDIEALVPASVSHHCLVVLSKISVGCIERDISIFLSWLTRDSRFHFNSCVELLCSFHVRLDNMRVLCVLCRVITGS